MTKPSLVRDADGSQWALQSDGTYNLRADSSLSPTIVSFYQGWTLERISNEIGIIGKTFDTPQGDQDYKYLRRA